MQLNQLHSCHLQQYFYMKVSDTQLLSPCCCTGLQTLVLVPEWAHSMSVSSSIMSVPKGCTHRQAVLMRPSSMSTPNILRGAKRCTAARVITPSLQPMSRHRLPWNHRRSNTCDHTKRATSQCSIIGCAVTHRRCNTCDHAKMHTSQRSIIGCAMTHCQLCSAE